MRTGNCDVLVLIRDAFAKQLQTDLFIRGKVSELLDTLSDPPHIVLMLSHASRGMKFGKPSY